MNKKTKQHLIEVVKSNIKNISSEELFDNLDEFRYLSKFLSAQTQREMLVDQTLYLIELDRRTHA